MHHETPIDLTSPARSLAELRVSLRDVSCVSRLKLYRVMF